MPSGGRTDVLVGIRVPVVEVQLVTIPVHVDPVALSRLYGTRFHPVSLRIEMALSHLSPLYSIWEQPCSTSARNGHGLPSLWTFFRHTLCVSMDSQTLVSGEKGAPRAETVIAAT